MELTLEKSLANIQMVLDNFVGKKAEHVALEKSMEIIKNNLKSQTNEETTIRTINS